MKCKMKVNSGYNKEGGGGVVYVFHAPSKWLNNERVYSPKKYDARNRSEMNRWRGR